MDRGKEIFELKRTIKAKKVANQFAEGDRHRIGLKEIGRLESKLTELEANKAGLKFIDRFDKFKKEMAWEVEWTVPEWADFIIAHDFAGDVQITAYSKDMRKTFLLACLSEMPEGENMIHFPRS
jgi:hypothetical protein